jgi:glutathione S-transferase
MKIYYFPIAPNPTRVMVYLREKNIALEEVLVDLRQGEQLSAEHLARNPAGTLPVLELDSGEYIAESLPIMEYLEELHPTPAMIGSDPLSRLRTRAFERQVETGILNPMARFVHASNSPLGLPPKPEVAAIEWERVEKALGRLEQKISDGPFLAGETPTIADCTLFAALQFGEAFGAEIPKVHTGIHRWYAMFRERPSTVSG